MNILVLILVVLAYPAMVMALGAMGAGAVIAQLERRVTTLGALVATVAENIWFDQVIPRIRNMCLVMIAGLWLAVFLSALVAADAPELEWNIGVTACVAFVFSLWLGWVYHARADMPEPTDPPTLPPPERPAPSPESFSPTAFINASFTGFLVMGLVEFYAGNMAKARPIVQIGTFYILFALNGMLKQGVLFVVKLAAKGVFSLEGMTNVVTSLAVGLITVGKSSLKDVFGKDGAQIAQEETWAPTVNVIMSRVIASMYPMFIFCNLLPGLDVLAVMVLLGMMIFLLWGNLEAVNINTWYLRQKAAITVYRIGYLLMIVVALTLLVPGLPAEFDALRETGNKLVTSVFQESNRAIVKAMGGLVAMIISGGLLYAVWPKKPDAPLSFVRKCAGIVLGLVVLFCVGKVIWVFAEPEYDKFVAAWWAPTKKVFSTRPSAPAKPTAPVPQQQTAQTGSVEYSPDVLEMCRKDPRGCQD